VRSNRARIALAVGAIAAIVVLFVVLNGGNDSNKDSSSSSSSTNTTNTTGATTPAGGATVSTQPIQVVTVQGGKPVGGIKKLEYTKGDQVRFRVKSDVADEIHVHGYDFHKDVPAGGSVSFSFPAKIEGVFVIELEGRGEQIAELRVSPS
jgi:hypothetical protein